jgi:DNA-binding Lrp family transcriptional regulator
MAKVFVFINVDPGAEKEALKQLRALPEVKESYSVDGVYDIVAILETNSMDQLKEAIVRKVCMVDGVSSTLTALVT